MNIKIGNLFTLQTKQRPDLNGKVVKIIMINRDMYSFTCEGQVLKTSNKDLLKPLEVVND